MGVTLSPDMTSRGIPSILNLYFENINGERVSKVGLYFVLCHLFNVKGFQKRFGRCDVDVIVNFPYFNLAV